MSISTSKPIDFSKSSDAKPSQKIKLVSVEDGPPGSEKSTPQITSVQLISEHVDAVKQIVQRSRKLSTLSNERAPFEYLTLPDHVDNEWLDQAEIELKQLQARDNWTPLGLKGAAVFLEQIAATLGVEIPEQHGAELYLELLEDLPSGPVKRAQRQILKTHAWKTLPLPAEIHKAVWSDEIYRTVKKLENQIKRMRLKLKLTA